MDLPITLTLPNRQVRRLTGPVRVRAESGLLWITVDGEPEDILLTAGECRRFERGAKVLVYALDGDARFHVSAAAALVRRWGDRWMSWWRGALPALR